MRLIDVISKISEYICIGFIIFVYVGYFVGLVIMAIRGGKTDE